MSKINDWIFSSSKSWRSNPILKLSALNNCIKSVLTCGFYYVVLQQTIRVVGKEGLDLDVLDRTSTVRTPKTGWSSLKWNLIPTADLRFSVGWIFYLLSWSGALRGFTSISTHSSEVLILNQLIKERKDKMEEVNICHAWEEKLRSSDILSLSQIKCGRLVSTSEVQRMRNFTSMSCFSFT